MIIVIIIITVPREEQGLDEPCTGLCGGGSQVCRDG